MGFPHDAEQHSYGRNTRTLHSRYGRPFSQPICSSAPDVPGRCHCGSLPAEAEETCLRSFGRERFGAESGLADDGARAGTRGEISRAGCCRPF